MSEDYERERESPNMVHTVHKVNGEVLWRVLKDLGFENWNEEESLFVAEVESLFAKLFSHDGNRMTTEDIESSAEISLSWSLKCYDR